MKMESKPCECMRKIISSRRNMKCEVLRYDFVLCVSHTETPVSLKGSEGRNEIRVKARQTSSFADL